MFLYYMWLAQQWPCTVSMATTAKWVKTVVKVVMVTVSHSLLPPSGLKTYYKNNETSHKVILGATYCTVFRHIHFSSKEKLLKHRLLFLIKYETEVLTSLQKWFSTGIQCSVMFLSIKWPKVNTVVKAVETQNSVQSCQHSGRITKKKSSIDFCSLLNGRRDHEK